MFKPSSLTTTCLMLLSLTWLIFPPATVAAQPSSMEKTSSNSPGNADLPAGRIQAVSLLGSKAKLAYRQGADGPPMQLPAKPSEGIAHALRITLDSTAQPNIEAK